MSECPLLIRELKRQLKLRHIQYSDIAQELELTEGSVKRLLAEGSQISLARLEAICRLMNLEMTELFRLVSEQKSGLTALTLEQEACLVEDKALLLVAVCVSNGYRFDEILARYRFTPNELVQKLAQLDRMGIIELQPNNRIKLKLAPDFSWAAGGPIQRFFQQYVQEAFFRSHFAGDDEKLMMATGLLSVTANKKLQQRFEKLVQEFYAACRHDQSLDLAERHGTSMVLAIRHWNFPPFDEFDTQSTEQK